MVDAKDEAERVVAFAWPRLAASVSVQLIETGARAVVAAGWAVDDHAARAFARSFYTHLLEEHESFGTSVKGARADVYDGFPNATTWGAYQCYGEPDWQLRPRVEGAPHAGERPFAAMVEVIAELASVQGDVNTGIERDGDRLRRRLANIRERADDLGGLDADAEAAARLGAIYGDLGDLQEALRWYDRAITAERASVPITAIEQRANLRARLAVRQFRSGAAKNAEEACTQIEMSLDELKHLIAIAGETGERLALLGSIYKRMAQVTGKRADFEKMRDKYLEAEKHALARNKSLDPYYRGMYTASVLVLGLTGDSPANLSVDVNALLAPARVEAERRYADHANFWDGINRADADLLAALTDPPTVTPLTIARLFLDPWRRNGSALMMRSVLEQVAFLIDALSADAARRSFLDELYNALRAETGLE